MKQLFSIVFLFAVLTSTHVSYAQDESPGKKVATENQFQEAQPFATINFQFSEISNFAFHPIQTVNSVTVYAFDNQLACEPVRCLSNADYGNYSWLKIIDTIKLTNKRLYTSNYKVPAHQTRNCATGYICV